jgi:hypothetical protein
VIDLHPPSAKALQIFMPAVAAALFGATEESSWAAAEPVPTTIPARQIATLSFIATLDLVFQLKPRHSYRVHIASSRLDRVPLKRASPYGFEFAARI